MHASLQQTNITVQRALVKVRAVIFCSLTAARTTLWIISNVFDGADMREATRDAVRYMIAFLVEEHGLDRVAAYMLCSVAGDLRLHEVVSCHFVNL